MFFFETGKVPSKVVNLVYNFQVSNGSITSAEESTVMSCSNYQMKYVWSESFIYLLGPRPLMYFTLFAVRVNVLEDDAAIDLPCMCLDTYGILLSRLTYMVKITTTTLY